MEVFKFATLCLIVANCIDVHYYAIFYPCRDIRNQGVTELFFTNFLLLVGAQKKHTIEVEIIYCMIQD